MTGVDSTDPLWSAAWQWVVREHEQPLDPAERAGLAAWLAEDRAHRLAYEEASRIWLAAALVPEPDDSDGSSS